MLAITDMEVSTVEQLVDTPGWQPPQSFRDARLHMVGIGGSGMSGLAAVLLRRGARVSGTDRQSSARLDHLARCGARVSTTQDAGAVPPDVQTLVISAAIRPDHPEVVEARRRKIPVIKYARLLGALMAQHDGIAVAGTHGKSTTTAWLAFTLRSAGCDPSFVVGAEVGQLGGGSGVGDGPHFLAEACEYDRSFLNLRPRAAVILNIDEDHLDCYRDLAAITEAFAEFARLLPSDGLLLLNGDDANSRPIAAAAAARVETFGLGPACHWRATDLRIERGCHGAAFFEDDRALGRVRLGLPGRHNVLNALAVTALARHAGVRWPQIAEALAGFRGARRRLEVRGTFAGVTIVDDYAHHPAEIQATLRAARERFEPRRLWCVFQPHQHSRTRFLLSDFAQSFALADRIVVPRIYFVRDSQRERQAICAADLVEHIRAAGGAAEHIPDFATIADTLLASAEPGDLVMTMGAGDIWKVADELVQRLGNNRPH